MITKKKNSLKQVLGAWDSVAINIAIVLGVGIFIVPSEVAKYINSPRLFIFAWILGGIISLLGALCYAELSSMFPETGGNYVYLRESYGLHVAFLFGWTEFLVIRTGSIAAVSFIFAEYLRSFLSGWCGISLKPIAIVTVLALTLINIRGIREGKKIQNTAVIAKILIIVGIIAIGVAFKKGSMANFCLISAHGGKNVLLALGLALIPILWTYGGWHENTFLAGETKNAKKVIPFALVFGVCAITALYAAINWFYVYLLPLKQISGTNVVAAKAAQILLGPQGKGLFEILVMVSSLGCVNAMILTGSRVTFAMSKDSAFFKWMGEVDDTHNTPKRAMVINALWSVALIICGTFNELLFFTGITVWLFFAITAGGIFILRRKAPGIKRPNRISGYSIVPVLFIFVSMALVLNIFVNNPVRSLVGLCIALTGVPFFVMQKKRRDLQAERGDA